MIARGWQIKAARAVLGWRQEDLAEAAGLHVNSIKYWEGQEGQLPLMQHGMRQIREAFEMADIVFVLEPGPGICFVDRSHLRRRRTGS